MEFDFDPETGEVHSNAPEFTVSELSGAVKKMVEAQFSYVRVRGEIGRVSQPASGHVYLDLKDEKSVLSGVIWRAKAASLAIRPEQGLEVIATGKLTTFPGQSKYQIVIDKIEPAGQGALMALLEARKKQLASEGLFDESAKQKLPFMPRVIGIVTSPTGAVIRDMMHGFRERFPVHVLVWPVRVQGELAAKEITAAIEGFNHIEGSRALPRPGVLIVARGGGSLEDLWSFNEEIVARAAANSKIPLISAVGHETDWTLIDYVADARAPTPTKAAEWAVPQYTKLLTDLADLEARQIKAQVRTLNNWRNSLKSAARGLPRLVDIVGIPRQRLDGASERLLLALRVFARAKRSRYAQFEGRLQPHLIVGRLQQSRERLHLFSRSMGQQLGQHLRLLQERFQHSALRLRPQLALGPLNRARDVLRQYEGRFQRAASQDLLARRQKLNSISHLLNSLGYQNVLARGFALVRDEAGDMVRRADSLNPGQMIDIEFVDGRVFADVRESEPDKRATKKPIRKKASASQAPKKAKKTESGGQGSLF